ncbi:TPA: hypothetical protein HA251_00125 [Candidatus Woesearchaeota archaeon]|nr:hypothetical protein [Candidatus Woesearchaeota archaeon]
MAIGFNAVEENAKQAEETIHAQKIEVCKAEDSLRNELRKLEDMEHNLKILERRMHEIRELSEEHDRTARDLINENMRRESMPEKIITLLIMLTKTEKRLGPLIHETAQQAQRLMVTEAGVIALQERDRHDTILHIDDRARAITAEVSIINSKLNAYDDTIASLRSKYKNYAPARNKIGF